MRTTDILRTDFWKEQNVLFSAAVSRISNHAKQDYPGTCFAGKGKVCSMSFTPDLKKSERLRTQAYW